MSVEEIVVSVLIAVTIEEGGSEELGVALESSVEVIQLLELVVTVGAVPTRKAPQMFALLSAAPIALFI